MHIDEILKKAPQSIDLTDADIDHGPYCMSFGFDLGPLIRSIKNVGLINHPLLMKNDGKGFTVIVGYRRIQAVKSLGWNRILCSILPESAISPLESLLLNLYDNLLSRGLNEVEKAMVLRNLLSLAPQEDILKKYMPLLDLPSHEPTLSFYSRLEQGLNDEIKQSLVLGNISMQTAKSFLEMDNNTRMCFFQLISELKLSINQQRQLIDYTIDISHRDKISAVAFFKDPSIVEVVSDPHMNNPQKAKAILGLLRNRLFPRLVQAENTFRKKVAGLGLHKGVKIDPPPFFESPHYRLTVLFKDGEELRRKIRPLIQAEGLGSITRNFETDPIDS